MLLCGMSFLSWLVLQQSQDRGFQLCIFNPDHCFHLEICAGSDSAHLGSGQDSNKLPGTVVDHTLDSKHLDTYDLLLNWYQFLDHDN